MRTRRSTHRPARPAGTTSIELPDQSECHAEHESTRAQLDDISSNAAENTAPEIKAEKNEDEDMPLAYKPEFAHIAYVMCQIGATDWVLALAFKVEVSTINKWQRMHKEFFEACKAGSNFADDAVERELYQRARGYSYAAVKIMHYKRRAIVVHYEKHVPADVKAAIYWLSNRMPEEWSDNPKLKQQAEQESDLTRHMRQTKFNVFRPKEN